jgi:hypothetical protein
MTISPSFKTKSYSLAAEKLKDRGVKKGTENRPIGAIPEPVVRVRVRVPPARIGGRAPLILRPPLNCRGHRSGLGSGGVNVMVTTFGVWGQFSAKNGILLNTKTCLNAY